LLDFLSHALPEEFRFISFYAVSNLHVVSRDASGHVGARIASSRDHIRAHCANDNPLAPGYLDEARRITLLPPTY
jgi:hypothetical protein